MADNHLSALQIQQVNLKVGELVAKHLNEMGLRKWSMEQALTHPSPGKELIDVARQIYHFVSRPALLEVAINPEEPF